jgi:hypothetical protein
MKGEVDERVFVVVLLRLNGSPHWLTDYGPT